MWPEILEGNAVCWVLVLFFGREKEERRKSVRCGERSGDSSAMKPIFSFRTGSELIIMSETTSSHRCTEEKAIITHLTKPPIALTRSLPGFKRPPKASLKIRSKSPTLVLEAFPRLALTCFSSPILTCTRCSSQRGLVYLL